MRPSEEWNTTQEGYARDRDIPDLFEEQAGRTPDAVAVIGGGRRLTYRELSEQSNRLARFLRRQGVGPDVLVALCLERSPEVIVALLAILKAGGAYLPLDPSYPKERLAWMLADSQARLLLTQRSLLDLFPNSPTPLLCLEEGNLDAKNIKAPCSHPTGAHLAYVLYTSGSTGAPKGVQVTRRSLVNVLGYVRACLDLSSADTILAITTLSFDIAAVEVWLPLLVGARIAMAPRQTGAIGSELVQRLADSGATVLQGTPVTWQLLLDAGWPGRPGFKGICCGEPLPRSLAERLLDRGVDLWNLYGPTETAVFSTGCRVERGEGPVSIGGPVANTRVYLLDEQLQPVPTGATGELYIEGNGLARGYLGRPGLTAERFLPNPFTREPGARLYRTGDLGRWRPDGTIDFLGRTDYQVKLRGYRIELGEIEETLRRHPAVAQAVVVAREAAPGDVRLVAYLVSRPNLAPDVARLRSFLQEKLPPYMVPSAFVPLEALPLTPSGKVDRRALPAPTGIRPTPEFLAPRTPLEEAVAEVWSRLLQVPQIGADDDFFALGGHSLLAAQAVSRLGERFHVDLSVRTLFDAPTVAGLAGEIERAQNAGETRLPPITAVSREGPLPLSFAQQRLWFFDRLVPNSPLYNVPLLFQLDGAPDVAVLERCLQEIARRHESLRTVFGEEEGRPRQVILPPQPFSLPLQDLAHLPAQERRTEARRLLDQAAQEPFDLAHGLPWRALLLQLDDREYQLLVTVHHIAFDGWSTELLVQELGALYDAFSQDRPSPLPELPLQYADFAGWQRGPFQEKALDRPLAYWQERFRGPAPVPSMPTDRPRPANPSYHGARLSCAIDPALLQALTALGRRQNASLFMTLLAALALLLHRYSSQPRVVIGAASANRSPRELEGLIGFFVNMLPLAVDLSGGVSFLDLLAQVRRVALEGYAFQSLPLEKLVEALRLERDLSYHPLFQVVLVMQDPIADVHLPGLQLSFLQEMGTDTAKFDLTLFVELAGSGARVVAEYSTDLYDESTVARLLDHWQMLLHSIVDNPAAHLSDLPLLPEAERRQLLYTWNDTGHDFPRRATVSELFEAQAARAPEAVALLQGEQRLTYGELNRRANRLARQLLALGVGPEVLVGICLERSVELVVALLAILKAGGAYLPLDPHYPPERIAFMLQDAAVPFVLTERRLLEKLPAQAARFICLDVEEDQSAGQDDNLPVRATADDLAYVMYTSGSTGRPKGVCVRHRSIVRLVWENNFAHLGPDEVLLHFAPISFDASTLEIWGSLLNGARLAILPGQEASLAQLARALQEYHISTLWLTGGLFQQMVEEQLDSLRGLRQLLAGGDALSVSHVRRALQTLAGCCLINGYGPTENTTFTCCYPMRDDGQVDTTVPIGRPIANTQVYILDGSLSPAPIGVPGELYTGGEGLAWGYLNRPGLTAERFVPHPFSQEPGARLYRTGDLARWRPDGTIEFLGRADFQVKIRGYRIEPGEIEAVLGRHPQITTAVVIPRPDPQGDKRLVAYLVSMAPRPTVGELRQYLQQWLPDFMVPAIFSFLDAMPLTPNGKIDRDALPEPDSAHLEGTQVLPRTAVEEVTAGIWARLLGLEGFGVHDNFFELGGHSLLATRVISRLSAIFQVDLPLQVLFEAPTIAELAQVVVSREPRPGYAEQVAQVLKRIEGLSAAEKKKLMSETNQVGGL